MKKFASTITALLLVTLMAVSGIVTVFAETTVDTTKKGSISLKKYDIATVVTDDDGNITDGKTVAGATFSAYRILDFDGKTYNVNNSFTGQVEVSDIVNISASQAGTLSYGSTNALEAQISKLQNYINTNSTTATASGTTDSNGSLKLENLELGVYLVQETAVPQGYTVSTQAFLVAVPTWDQEANDGAGKWVYDVTANPKDELLQVDKEITDDAQGTTDGTNEDSYSIGDTIPYTVTAKIPNYGQSADYPALTVTENLLLHYPETETVTAIDKYNALNLEFTDTMTKGLTLDLNSLEIKILDAQGNEEATLEKGTVLAELASFTTTGEGDTERVDVKTAVTNGKDYTATETENSDGSTTMNIEVAWNSVDAHQGCTIQLKYKAQLDTDAVAGTVNQNDVTYSFSNDPQNATGEAEDPTRTDTVDENKVYTYEMDLTKTFNDKATPDSGSASDVEFELSVKNDTATNKLNVIKTADGTYTIWTGATETVDNVTKAVDIVNNQLTGEATKTYVGNVVTTLNPDNSGKLVVKGFEAGTYELKETKSVAGYTILTEPVTILVKEVKEGDPEVVTEKVSAYTLQYNENGNLTEKDNLTTDTANAAKGIFLITVNNAKNQFNLPLTGGMGLWMFTIGGGVVMAGAIIFFSMLRKKKSEE